MSGELYRDPSASIAERVEDLLSRMTLEEKAMQLCGNLPANVLDDGKVNREKLKELFPNGLGRITQYSLAGLGSPEQIAKVTNELQDYFVHGTRLGIPVALQSENLCGYPSAGGTVFPAPINVGSTWKPEDAGAASAIIGQETRAVGITSAMSPLVDIARDPRWGRTYETFGEDTYLVSQMGLAYIRGMQEQGVSCIAKHFLGYAQTQGGLNLGQARINDRELYELFATPFEAAIKGADLDGIMANYGEIDGLPVIDNPKIARTLLRDTMGFQGMLTSDGAAVSKTYTYYHVANSYKEAGLLAKRAGCDTEIPVGGAFAQLPDYVRSGELDGKYLDESVRRILTIKFKRGLFENPYADTQRLAVSMTGKDKQAVSRRIAADSMILLKNDGVLPLAKGKKIALIGPHAASRRYPYSGYTFPAYIEMMEERSRGQGVSFNGIADEDKKKSTDGYSGMKVAKERIPSMESALDSVGAKSLKEVLETRFSVAYAEGCTLTGLDKDGFDAAVKAAGESDIVVMTLGGNSGWVNVTGGEGKDRCRISLPGVQEELLETVAAVGKPVVLVLYGPQVFAVNWAQEHVSAILEAYLPGPYGAFAVADVLDGTVNPGGRLSMSVPRCEGQIPVIYNSRAGSGYTAEGDDSPSSDIFSGGYVDGPASPLYSFGYGLSYTTFEKSGLKLSAVAVPTDGELLITVTDKNTGVRTGDDTVQLYTAFHGAHVTRPSRTLSGFRRITLAPGEEKTLTFHLKMNQLGYYNEAMEFVVEPGILDVMISDGADCVLLKESVQLTGQKVNIMGRRSYTCEVTEA